MNELPSPLNWYITQWLVPRGFQRLCHRLLTATTWSLAADERRTLNRNKKFHDVYKGRRCFIIGAGPSLAKQDLRPLASEITICMSFFNKLPIIDVWKPTVYCAAEPPSDFPLVRLEEMVRNIDAQAYLFNVDMKPMLDECQLLPRERVHFVKTNIGIDNWPLSRGLDLTRMILAATNTAHLALMLGIYMGCSPIYLIGLDHDWLTHRSFVKHCYDTYVKAPETYSNDLNLWSYKDIMETMLAIWKIYEVLQAIARRKGIRIYNATDGGFLDVFDRVRYESLFEKLK
jgi:hypothetical protein